MTVGQGNYSFSMWDIFPQNARVSGMPPTRPTQLEAILPASASPVARDADIALVERVAAGNRLAFKRLVERHADRAFSLSLRILGEQAQAEAVVEHVMTDLWANARRCLATRLPFRTWLCGAIVSRCRPFDSRAEISKAAGTAIPSELAPDEAPELALEQAMLCLSWSERVAIVLFYQEGIPNEGIALAMQITGPNVEALLAGARRNLWTSLPALAGESIG